MQKLEKRTSARHSLQIPLHFHSDEMAVGELEIAAETSNISHSGLFMASPMRLRVGASLSLTLRVPTYLSGSARSSLHCAGHVVHERHLPNGDLGYGVQFERMLSFQNVSPTLGAAPPGPTVSHPI